MIRTPRLVLRAWRDSDVEAFAAMNGDARVMAYFPQCLSASQSAASARRIRNHFAEHGFGYWVVEAPGVAPFIGVSGLLHTRFDAPFTPCIEIGWRFCQSAWRQGYATEAARAALAYGFDSLGLAEIVSFTVPDNFRSILLMERLGFARDGAGDFDHPHVPCGHELRHHVLYRLRRADFQSPGRPPSD